MEKLLNELYYEGPQSFVEANRAKWETIRGIP